MDKDANPEIGVPRGAPGWYSRGYLPHFDDLEKIQHISFHLADSLPKEALLRMEDQIRRFPKEQQDVERRKRIEAWLDAGHGSCVLREPTIAKMVQDALLFFHGQRYQMIAWVIMPNHVHTLFQVMNGWTHKSVTTSWKKWTATRICAFRRESSPGHANLPIGASGANPDPVWHREDWDRYTRNEEHFQRALDYIHQNPVKAGLVMEAEKWPWSSAWRHNLLIEGFEKDRLGNDDRA